MTHIVDTQPDQPLLSSQPTAIESADTEYGNMVHLDVIDLAAPDDDY
ncbi:hypothetical protein [Aeromonas tecta]|nr:hypothetical protein [Aeromonas tecta]